MDSGCSAPTLVKGLGKPCEFKATINTNIVFCLTTKATGRLLRYVLEILCLFLIGDIDGMTCIAGNTEIDSNTFTTFCWARVTYLVGDLMNATDVPVPYPGVGTLLPHHSVIYYEAYPWFPMYLCFLYMSFYLVWDLWSFHFEGAHLKHFYSVANNVVMEEDDMIKLKNSFVDYLVVTRHRHKAYAYKFSLCEILNMVHLCVQVWAAELMMGGGFSTYGYEVVNFYLASTDVDQYGYPLLHPKIKYFPIVTKCSVPTTGPSGNRMEYSGICIMPLHNLIDKIFLFLWFWYAFLFIMNTIGLLYRLAVLYIPPLRQLLLLIQSRQVNPNLIRTICKYSDYGDWYYIFSIRNSVRNWICDAILTDFGERLAALEE